MLKYLHMCNFCSKFARDLGVEYAKLAVKCRWHVICHGINDIEKSRLWQKKKRY